jgi:beta-glucanase (GH16 family)
LFFDARAAAPSERYKLDWEEDFLDPKRYATRWAFRAPGWRAEGYLNSPDTVSADFAKGYVAIRTEFGSPHKAGMISTQGKVSFAYGYFEVKMTLPHKAGNHVAFWLKSDDYDKVGPPETHGAEVDVIEYLPRTPTTAYFNVHGYGYVDRHRTVGDQAKNIVCAGCTHIFGLEWTPESYRFYVDGKPMWTTNQLVSRVPMYVILSSHTSRWAGRPEQPVDSDEVRFHYVRYYKR